MMPARNTTKVAYYLRSTHQGQLVNLEHLMRQARSKLSTVASTEIDLDTEVLRLQNLEHSESMLFIHIVRYVPGEQVSTLRPKQTAPVDTEVPHEPPHGMEYKDGDAYLLICGGHVIFCSHGITQTRVKVYLTALLTKGGVDHETRQFKFTPAANIAHLDLIRKHGVKTIRLSAGAYLASTNSAVPKGILGKAFAQLDAMLAPFKRDDTADEIKAMENLIVKLELNLDGNTRARDESKEYIGAIAEAMLNEPDDIEGEMSIVTRNGETIDADHVRLQKRLSVQKVGKNLDYEDLRDRMLRYYNELRDARLLER